jgi:hypothetical protein
MYVQIATDRSLRWGTVLRTARPCKRNMYNEDNDSDMVVAKAQRGRAGLTAATDEDRPWVPI